MKAGADGHALAGRAPHVAGVDVEPAVVVVVEERRAHPGAVVQRRRPDAATSSNVTLPSAPPEVAVEVLGAEVVRDEQVGPAVAVVVGPGGGEVIAVVAGVEARLLGRRRRTGRGRRCGTARRAARCARRSTASACPPCPRRRRRNTSRRTGRDRGSRRGRSRPSRSTSARPGAAAANRKASATGVKRPLPSFRKSSGLVPVASTRSWSPSLSTSAKSDCAVSSRTPRPGAARSRPRTSSRRGPGRAGWAARPAGRRRDPRGRRRRRRRPRRRGGRSSRA